MVDISFLAQSTEVPGLPRTTISLNILLLQIVTEQDLPSTAFVPIPNARKRK